jgi:uncharacterized membrane protein
MDRDSEMETHSRSILKAVTWRAGGTVVTCAVAWLLTGNLDMAAKIGLLDTGVKIGAFYFHERLWNRSSFGKMEPPEYQI